MRLSRLVKADRLPGGLGDDTGIEDFDSEQVALGLEVEQEHTDDSALAEEIVKDHLAEDPAYYTKLQKMGI